MEPQLHAQRRILFRAYQSYLLSERALLEAKRIAMSWLPDATARNIELIGNPGSRIRRLYERRDRAIARLRLARLALQDAQERAEHLERRQLFLIEVHRPARF